MLTTLDWGIIAIFFMLSLGIGIWASKKAGKDTESFFLAGKDMPWWLLFAYISCENRNHTYNKACVYKTYCYHFIVYFGKVGWQQIASPRWQYEIGLE